MLLTAQLRNAV